MGVVDPARPLADPQEMGGQVVESLLGVTGQPGAVVRQTEHRPLVVQDQRLVRGEDVGGTQVLVGHAARVHEPQAAVDLGRQRLVARAGRGAGHELHVPLVDTMQVGRAGRGERPDEVHGGRGVGVGTDQSRRVVLAGGLIRLEGVDHVAAVGQQSGAVAVRRPRLGVLAGDTAHLDHRHRGAVGEDDGHLQQRAEDALDVGLGIGLEGLGAVAALEQERPAVGDLGQPVGEVLDLGGDADRRDALEHLPHGGGVPGVPRRLLQRRAPEGVGQQSVEIRGERGQVG